MSNKSPKLLYTRDEMLRMNIEVLKSRGVSVDDISAITYAQQSRYTKDISKQLCEQSVLKVLSYRDTFHFVQLAAEIDRLAEEKAFRNPIQDIIYNDLGLFGIDETLGLDLAGLYGTIGQTNFGDIDVNKVGVIKKLDFLGKQEGHVQTFLDDIVGAIAAAASTRVAQVINEEMAAEDLGIKKLSIFDFEDDLQ